MLAQTSIRRVRRWAAMSVWLLAATTGAGAATATASAGEPVRASTRQGGLAVEVRVQAVGTEPGRYMALLDFTDAGSGTALPGLRPAAWLQLRRSPAELEISCEDRARQFVAGLLGARADVDLNAYRLVTLNQDRSLHFINPLVRIRNSRLEATVQLSGNGYDWVFAPDAQRLAVTLRDEGRLALVDTLGQRLAGELDLGGDSLPTRVIFQPGSARVWVGLDGAGALAVVDLAEQREVARVPLNPDGARSKGPITLAAVPGRPWLVAALAGDSSAVLLDMAQARVLGRVPLPAGPVAVAYSAAAERMLVLSGQAGVLSLLQLHADGLRLDSQVDVGPGALALAPMGDGRHVLVTNVQRHDVALVDLAQGSVRDRVNVADWPDQIVATRDFAYVRSQGSNRVTLLPLDIMRMGKLQPLVVPMGRAAASEMPQSLNVASLMAPAPEGKGIYAAVAADAQIYRYAEGLMVPSGSLGNYRRNARSLMVLDYSLREVAAGRFEVPLRVRRGGAYELVVRNASPSLTACMTVALQGPAAASAPQVAAPRPRLIQWQQQGQNLRFSVQLDETNPQGPSTGTDLQALLLGPHNTWQRRAGLQPVGAGRWQGQLLLPAQVDAASASLLLQSEQLGLPFHATRLGMLGSLPPSAVSPHLSQLSEQHGVSH